MTRLDAISEPYALPKDEGRRTWSLGGLFIWKAEGHQTQDQAEVFEIRGRAGVGSPIHTHTRQIECFYILEGELTYLLGEKEVRAAPGAFVLVPPKTRHALVVESEEARFLSFVFPAGLVKFFDEVGKPAEAATLPPLNLPMPDPAGLEAAARRSDQTILGPPLRPRRVR
jgi:quercetin dioxygenase-like cupin family protein